MAAVSQYSYLTSYHMIPEGYDENNLTWATFRDLSNEFTFEEYSRYILIDSIDSIARVWLRVWSRYQDWLKKKS